MNEVKAHYDNLLGSVYSWIIGDFEAAYARSARLFERLDLSPSASGIAVDLGAGPGTQSLPLAERGFRVVAIDFCETLLAELRERSTHLAVQPVLGDISRFREYLDASPELIVCMGDTLVHLPDKATVERVLQDAAGTLNAGGSLIISLRDYTTEGPEGADRFIPIRSSQDRIFTCFLEYREHDVQVSDILQQRIGDDWQLSISSYRKLRLEIAEVEQICTANGLTLIEQGDDGEMLFLRFRK